MAVVWASSAMINPANLRALSHSFSDASQVKFAIECRRKNDVGESLIAACFPPEIYVDKDASTNYAKLPQLFFAGSYWVVSGAVAHVMRQFDLGSCNLYPTKVYRKDRKTPIGDEWFCLNFGNVKRAFLPDASTYRPLGSKPNQPLENRRVH